MTNTKVNSAVGFALRQIVTKQFAIIDDVYTDGSEVNSSIEIQFAADVESRIISAIVGVKMSSNENLFLLISVSCIFQIKEESWRQFDFGDNYFSVPKEFLSFLVMHTVGTTRGILHSKTEGTKYNQFILPPINVTELIKDDFRIYK